MINKIYDALVGLWTSEEPPRIAKKALVVLFVVEACSLCGIMGISAIEGVKVGFHSTNPQRDLPKPFPPKAYPCNN
jgi:hypothetical protein